MAYEPLVLAGKWRGWVAYLVGAFVALAYIIILVWRGSVAGVRDIILWTVIA